MAATSFIDTVLQYRMKFFLNISFFTARNFLADRTATQYDRLLAAACCPSVRLSVRPSTVRLSVTLCIVALRVGVQR